MSEDVLYFSGTSAKNSASELGDGGSNMTGLLWLVGQPAAGDREGRKLAFSVTHHRRHSCRSATEMWTEKNSGGGPGALSET